MADEYIGVKDSMWHTNNNVFFIYSRVAYEWNLIAIFYRIDHLPKLSGVVAVERSNAENIRIIPLILFPLMPPSASECKCENRKRAWSVLQRLWAKSARDFWPLICGLSRDFIGKGIWLEVIGSSSKQKKAMICNFMHCKKKYLNFGSICIFTRTIFVGKKASMATHCMKGQKPRLRCDNIFK